MRKYAMTAVAATLLLALSACQSGGAGQETTPNDGGVPAGVSAPADTSYPAPSPAPASAYPSPS